MLLAKHGEAGLGVTRKGVKVDFMVGLAEHSVLYTYPGVSRGSVRKPFCMICTLLDTNLSDLYRGNPRDCHSLASACKNNHTRIEQQRMLAVCGCLSHVKHIQAMTKWSMS